MREIIQALAETVIYCLGILRIMAVVAEEELLVLPQ
jgi:hypothetical protein